MDKFGRKKVNCCAGLTVIFVLFFSFAAIAPKTVLAQVDLENGLESMEGGMSAPAISTRDDIQHLLTKGVSLSVTGVSSTVNTWETFWKFLRSSAAMAFRSGLGYYLNRLAEESATYLVTGGNGQEPMFYADPWGDFLAKAADGALGMFLDKLVVGIGDKTGWLKGFNVCDPNISVKISIALGLHPKTYEQPRCTFSQMKNNWEQELSSPDFLPRFQDMFNPQSSDLGVALTIQSSAQQKVQAAVNADTLTRLVGKDMKSKIDEITKTIKTPVTVIDAKINSVFNAIANEKLVYTGDILADSIGTFMNTLIMKLIEKWFYEGLISDIPDMTDIPGFEEQAESGGISAAKERFRTLLEPNFEVRADYDILASLASCPDPQNPGPSDCVITEKFRQAIANRLTIKSAMDQGYLNKSGVFGFVAGKSLEPKYENEDYPYRSLVILRKYRIIPVGWEIAAQYIKMHTGEVADSGDKGKNIGLKEMVACFDSEDAVEGYEESWCRGLVDPNWVLKAPLNYCKKLGFGSEITSKTITGEGDGSKTNISRKDDYCADEQSCIKEYFDGSCQVYGYCSEERRTWNFNNRSCDPRFNTCETFRSRSGDTASYLENTLDYNGCTADNVGCLGYCKTENYIPTKKIASYIIEQDYKIGGGKIRTRKWELPATFQNTQTAAEFYGYNPPKSLMENQWIVKADRSEFFIHYQTGTGETSGVTSIGWLHDKPQLVKCQAYDNNPDDPKDAQNEHDWCVNSANPGACDNGENWQYSDSSANCFEYTDQNGDGQYYCDNKISGRMEDRDDDVNCDGGEAALAFSKITAGNKVVVKDDSGDADKSKIKNKIEAGESWTEEWSMKNTDGGVIEMPSGNWEVEITPTLTMGVDKFVFAYEGGMLDASQGFMDPANEIKTFRIKSSPDTLSGEWQCGGAEDKIYFDKDAEKCDSGNEGCHELIRTKAGIGANLIINSGFEDYLDIGGWDKWGKVDSDRRSGASALKITDYDKDNPLSKRIAVGSREAGEYFTFSLYAKKCSGLKALLGEAVSETGLSESSDWQRLTLSAKIEGEGDKVKIGLDKVKIGLIEYPAGCVIDDMKLERGAVATDYGSYGSAGKIYEKLVPAYLEKSAENEKRSYCYKDVNPEGGFDYTFSSDALPECENFARKCNADEANCELYTSVRTKEAVPAKISAKDSCPAACVGYDMFIEKATDFDSKRDEYFIPKQAKTCNYASVGCDEFTNLDELEKGAEKKEYYSGLRQCVKSDEEISPGVSACNDFYTWEGSSETGFQLKVFKLKKDESDSDDGDDWDEDPADTDEAEGRKKCNEEIYNIEDMNDARFNSDCRQFYNRQGGISYHLYLKTISCSDNCHPYRRTENNYDDDVTEDNCPNNKHRHWDSDAGKCIVCRNGGTWRSDHNACVYMAIPVEGRTCSASQAGCREYNGNNGANVRTVFAVDFEENGDAAGWKVDPGERKVDSTAYIVGNHSLKVSGGAKVLSKKLGLDVFKDSSYILTFTAKAVGGDVVLGKPTLGEGKGSEFDFDEQSGTSIVGSEWRLFKFNLEKLDHDIAENETLIINTENKEYYIDNIKLTEITDRYYLIKNSWNTPVECDNKLDDPAGQKDYDNENCGEEGDGSPRRCFYEEMLNCDQYQDRDKIDYYLKSFSALCQDSAVGCELLIDTHNSTNPKATSYENGEAKIPADDFIYAVYDKKKTCNAADKGCARLGKPYSYSGQSVYQNEFLKNDPDVYPKILCSSSEDGCEEWVSLGSEKNYFKDPGDQVCEYRQAYGESSGWWKKQVQRCDNGSGGGSVNGKIDAEIDAEENPIRALENQVCVDSGGCGRTGIKCDSDAVCGAFRTCFEGECRYSCVLDANNYACQVDNAGDENGSFITPKTIGYPGVPIEQPDKEIVEDGKTVKWAGACPAAEAGCSEYIDPVSKFSANLIFNGDFSQDVDNNGWDGWNCNEGETECSQDLQLAPNTLYILSGEKLSGGSVSLTENEGAAKNINELVEEPDGGGANYLKNGVNAISFNLSGEKKKSRRFYVSGNGIIKATLKVNKITKKESKVELKEAVVSYQLQKNIDKTSCNGLVNFDDGCVLFNERTYAGSGWIGLSMNADTSKDGETPKIDSPANANVLIKVTPDRVCNEWLACRSAVGLGTINANGSEEQACFDIGACNRMDESGKCVSFVAQDNDKAMEAKITGSTSSNVSELANRSGYSKAGLKGVDDPGMQGYLPLGSMDQDGEVAAVPNGNFEIYGANKYPIGWLTYDDASWKDNLFSVINNPYAAQAEGGNSRKGGIGYPVEGISFLKYSSESVTTSPLSELIEVEPGADYFLSYRINTEDLRSKDGINDVKAAVVIERENKKTIGDPSFADKGQGWQLKVKKFNSGNSRNVQLHLASKACDSAGNNCADCLSGGNCIGNIYIDEIKIMPALKARDKWNLTQSCRLYPQSDSLSCDYFNDSGLREKGLTGYCLQYDRAPGSPENCLMWWPIDKVKGEGIEEGAGYKDRFPLYYTTEKIFADRPITTKLQVENGDPGTCARHDSDELFKESGRIDPELLMIDNISRITVNCVSSNDKPLELTLNRNNNWSDSDSDEDEGNCGDMQDKTRKEFDSDDCGGCTIESCCVDKLGGDVIRFVAYFANSHLDYFRVFAHETGGSNENYTCVATIHSDVPAASKIAQVASPGGQNKFWSGRAYKGSGYQFTCNAGLRKFAPGVSDVCAYESDYPLFGSLVYPYPSTNPYEWDSKGEIGIQPLYYEIPDTSLSAPYQPRMGQVVSENNAQRLFAKSYGIWSWENYGYKCDTGENAGDDCNTDDCPGGTCGTDSKCDTGANAGDSCDTDNCPGGTCNGGGRYINVSSKCSNDYSMDCETDDCPNGSCVGLVCNGGSRAGKSCSVDDCPGGYCILNWNPPDKVCGGDPRVRPEYSAAAPNADLCAIPPKIGDISVNKNYSKNEIINRNGFINLAFTSKLDAQQLPMTMIAVDWGDLEKTIITGVEMRDRQSSSTPHSLYHLYDYWDLKRKAATAEGSGIDCSVSGKCKIKPKIKIKDNWGWCNNGTSAKPYCPVGGYKEFPHWIVVKER